MNFRSIFLVLVVSLTCVGCPSTSNIIGPVIPPPNADVAGTWSFTANSANPPIGSNCTGALAGATVNLCASFTLPFQQTGTAVVGAATTAFCGFVYSVNANISGNTLSGVFLYTDGQDTFRTTFVASVNGDSIAANPAVFSIDGVNGQCTVAGVYDGVRQ